MSYLAEPSYQMTKDPELYFTSSMRKNYANSFQERYTNFWYILATTHQDQTAGDGVNPYAKEENRMLWNRFMCGDLPDKKKQDLKDTLDLPEDDFFQLTAGDWEKIKSAVEKCSDPNALRYLEGWKKPSLGDRPRIVFDNLQFDARILFDGFIFNGITEFKNCSFKNEISFGNACFIKRVDFTQSKFEKPVDFDGTRFMGNADFTFAQFEKEASYRNSYFEKITVFKGCNFKQSVDFSNASFLNTTSFHRTEFRDRAPRFFNTTIYEETIFSTDDKLWPNASSKKFKNEERVYARLRRYMNDIKKPDEEMFFHRLEMRAKATSQNWISSSMIHIYDFISDFGRSVYRPLGFLMFLIFAGWHFISTCECYNPSKFNPKIDGLLWSISNSIPLVKFSSVIGVSELTTSLKLFSIFQSIGSAILLFLVVLAVRNKFRLK